MRRTGFVASAVLALALVVPAQAGGERGRVMVPVGSPTIPRAAYMASPGMNGVTGWVFRLDPGAGGGHYALTVTHGSTGLEDADVYFYEDLPGGGGPGAPCVVGRAQQRGGTETGTICPGPQKAAWAIVVLTTGANARFTFTY